MMLSRKNRKKSSSNVLRRLPNEEIAKLSSNQLGKALNLSPQEVKKSTASYNKIISAKAPLEVRVKALELASELPGVRDIGPHFAEILVETGKVKNIGEIVLVRGIGTGILRAVTEAISKADVEELLGKAKKIIGTARKFPKALDILPIGKSNEIIRQPWFTGVLPGEMMALEGQVAFPPGDTNQHTFVVDPALTPGGPAVIPLLTEDFPVTGIPKGPVTLIGLGMLSGGIQPLLFSPFLGFGEVLIGWLPKLLIVATNIRVFRAILALKEQIRQDLLELFKYFGFNPGKPGLDPKDKGSQLIKLLLLKLAIVKEKLDLQTIADAIKAVEDCIKKLKDKIKKLKEQKAKTTNENMKKVFDEEIRQINKRIAKLKKAIEKLEDALQAKHAFIKFTLEFNLSGVPSPDPDEKFGFDEWDRKIVERLLELLKFLKKNVKQIQEKRKKMGKLSPGSDNDQDATGTAPAPDPDDLEKEFKKLEKEFEEKIKKFKKEQKANAERWKKKIEKACKEGNTERILQELKLQLAGIIDRNKWFLNILRDSMVPEEIAAVKKGKNLLKRIDTLLVLERETVDEAIKREKEAIKKAKEHPELHVAKLAILLELKALIEEQIDKFEGNGSGGVLDFGDEDEMPEDLDGLLDKKKEEAEDAKERLKDQKKKLDEIKKGLLKD